MCVCVYIYIVILRQTILLYYNSLEWLDMQDSSSWDGNLSDFMPVRYLNAQPISE